MQYNFFKLFFILNLLIYINLNCFNTLNDALKYSLLYHENPVSDNEDLENLVFNEFYKQITLNWFNKLLIKVGLEKTPIWQSKDLYESLKKIVSKIPKNIEPRSGVLLEVSKDTKFIIFGDIHAAFHPLVRCLESLKHKKIIDENFRILDNNTYFLFTGNNVDLSAHSLETLDLIIKILITNPGHVYYIKGEHENKRKWYGYSLRQELVIRTGSLEKELTKLIESFFESLPLAVFINLKNTNDIIAVSYYGPEEDPFKDIFCNLDNLPKKLKDIACNNNNKLPIKAYIKGNDPITFPGILRYIIDNNKTYKFGQGLYRISDIDGITSWTVVSCPIKLYMVKYEFYFDSYVILDIKDPLNNSTITNFYNDARTPLDVFRKGSIYNLVTGNLIKQGMYEETRPYMSQYYLEKLSYEHILKVLEFVEKRIDILSQDYENLKKRAKKIKNFEEKDINLTSKDLLPDIDILNKLANEKSISKDDLKSIFISLLEIYNGMILNYDLLKRYIDKIDILSDQTKEIRLDDSIVIGSSCDLSKNNKAVGLPMVTGMSLKISSKNKEGGINGKFIKPVFLDDYSIGRITRLNFEKILEEYKSNIILFPQGTHTLERCLDMIKSKKTFVFFPQSSWQMFRNPELKGLVNFRVSFLDQIKILTNYVLKYYKVKKISFFYCNNESNKEVLKAAQDILKKHGIYDWSEVPYDENAVSFKREAKKIKEFNPNSIAFISSANAVIKIIDELGIEFFVNKVLYGTASLFDDITEKYFEDKGLKIILPHVVPNPETSNLEIVQEYRNEVIKNSLKPNIFSLEGFIVTSILLDQISKLKGLINGQNIMEQIESIKEYTFKGLELNFNPVNRTIGKNLWIDDSKMSQDWIKMTIDQ